MLAFVFSGAFTLTAVAQNNECPKNIGFETGDFSKWKCYTGSIAKGTGVLDISQLGEIPGRHTIIPSTSTDLDPFGKFPIICPNGSNYSAMIGNSGTGSQAEKITYTFTVPANAPDYTFNL